MLRDLTGHVNEAHIQIYFRIYLFRVGCSGCMILTEWGMEKRERKGWGRDGEHGSNLRGLVEIAPGMQFTAPPSMGMASSALKLSS